jgi:hypothetical protein
MIPQTLNPASAASAETGSEVVCSAAFDNSEFTTSRRKIQKIIKQCRVSEPVARVIIGLAVLNSMSDDWYFRENAAGSAN